MFTHQKRLNSNFSTATNYQSKNLKNSKENYINDFDLRLRGGSHEKKLAIDVQSLIKSRSKAKSSMSNHSSKTKNHRWSWDFNHNIGDLCMIFAFFKLFNLNVIIKWITLLIFLLTHFIYIVFSLYESLNILFLTCNSSTIISLANICWHGL